MNDIDIFNETSSDLRKPAPTVMESCRINAKKVHSCIPQKTR